MGITAMVLGTISTVWALFGGMWITALIGIVGVILALIGMRRKSMGAAIGLLLSINGIAWSALYIVYAGVDPIAELLGLC